MTFDEMWPLGAQSLAMTSELWQHEPASWLRRPKKVHPREARQGE